MSKETRIKSPSHRASLSERSAALPSLAIAPLWPRFAPCISSGSERAPSNLHNQCSLKRYKAFGLLCFLLLLTGMLLGCQPKENALKFDSTDITGASFARDFKLTDHTGQERTLSDFAGKVVVMFFGFTQCPDVCPATLIEMKAVMEKLGDPLANDVQVLFVTVDPERDSAEILSQYVPAFDKRFLGLRGDLDAIKEVAREFKVYYGKVPGKTEGSYTIDHTASSYVFDKQGRVRLMVRFGAPVDSVVNDIRQLLKG